jgi:hypothetical protein
MKKEGLLVLALSLIIVFTILPLISAYNFGGWGYYNSPLDYLENEWIIFGIFFLVFFAIIFYTVNKAFKNNAVSGIIALGLSLMIAMVMARRGLLYGYLGEEIGSWILIITILIGIAFLIRFVYESFGKTGTIVALIGLWIVLRSIDPYEFLPYQLLTDTFINIYEFFASIFGGIILIIGALVILGITDPKTNLDRITKFLSKRGRH